MIKVCITDDHQLVLEGLILLLSENSGLEVMATFKTGLQLLDAIEKGNVPDVVLLDINMPELNGIETCKRLKRINPGIKVIALSMIGESNMIKLMLKSGADGYLHKNAGKDEITTAISEVMEGRRYLSQEITNIVLFEDLQAVGNKIVNSPFPKLSDREKQILSLIVDEKTTLEISNTLFIGFGTVETHRRNIMAKLGVKNTAGLVRTVLEYNLLEN
ncbi:MAG TPA: response regulator transcription factor [Saprospiraceae bacterium]|nr:response regulator transcription factor [Saprospiraceae bacterium]